MTADMTRQMEAERTEMEDKLRIAAKLIVLKKRESWAKERQQLLDKTRKMKERLSLTEEENRRQLTRLHRERQRSGLFSTISLLWRRNATKLKVPAGKTSTSRRLRSK